MKNGKDPHTVAAGLHHTEPKQDPPRSLARIAPGKDQGCCRPVVSIVRYGVCLLDRDNLWGSAKPLLDCLRKAGIIADDNEEAIELKVSQQKVAHRREQGTKVEILWRYE